MQDNQLNETLFFHIEKTMKLVKESTSKAFKENNIPITKDQWVILKQIAEENGSNQKEIADATFKDPAALTRILDILEKKNLVKRQASKKDRRTFEIFLSVEGKRLVDKTTPIVYHLKEKILKNVSTEDETTVKKILTKMQKNLT